MHDPTSPSSRRSAALRVGSRRSAALWVGSRSVGGPSGRSAAFGSARGGRRHVDSSRSCPKRSPVDLSIRVDLPSPDGSPIDLSIRLDRSIGDPRGLDRLESIDRGSLRGDPLGLDRGSSRALSLSGAFSGFAAGGGWRRPFGSARGGRRPFGSARGGRRPFGSARGGSAALRVGSRAVGGPSGRLAEGRRPFGSWPAAFGTYRFETSRPEHRK